MPSLSSLWGLATLVLFLAAVLGTLIVGSAQKWSLPRIGGAVSLVIMASNLLLVLAGRVTTISVVGLIVSGVVALSMLLADRRQRDDARLGHARDAVATLRNPEYSDVGDGPLVELAAQLSAREMDRLRTFGSAFLSVMGVVVALIFLGDRLQLPSAVPMALLLIVTAVAGPLLYLTLWKPSTTAQDVLLEVTVRGLMPPDRVRRVTPRTALMARRLGPPFVALWFIMLVLFALLLPYVAGVLADSGILMVFMFGLLATLMLCILWIYRVLLFTKDPLVGQDVPDVERPA